MRLIALLIAALALASPAGAETDCEATFRQMVRMLADDAEASPDQQILRMQRLAVFYQVCADGNQRMTDMAKAVADQAFGRPGN